MDEIEIYYTRTAINQRDLIFEYWNERNKSTNYSKKLNKSFKERIALLSKNPYLGKTSGILNYRLISLGHYSIYYKYDNNTIYVTAIWDN